MNLFELFIKLGVDDQASSKLSAFRDKLGNGLKTAAKIGTAAVGAAAAGIAALTTAAVNNYAEYEQLVGGVDTLFKNASQKLQGYAAEAYRTSGMSANDYMANATAFSASLISSLGGDTEAAAEYANRAMVSMSDNANKMGTSIDSIVQTYQSLSRGNFAMLDNLKLGYGGTKEELERLIADAATYTDVQKEMGITVDKSSMSFDNIVNAIAVVQGHLGIAGATAAEASTTIEGSVNSMKSAWSNLVTGIANDNADMESLIGDFIGTIVGENGEGGVLNNILPAIQKALTGASQLIAGVLPQLMQIIPSVIGENLPILTEAAVGIIQSLVDGIKENQEMLVTTAVDTIVFLATSLISMLPEIVAIAPQILISLANGITENLPELIPTIVSVILQIVETLTDPNTLLALVDASIAIIIALAEGIITALPRLLAQAPVIIANLLTAIIKAVPKLLSAGLKIVTIIADGIREQMRKLRDIGVNIVMGVWNGINEKISWFTSKVKNFFSGIVNGVKKTLGIASPSKVFASIGRFMADGVGKGWDSEFSGIKSRINNSLDFGSASLSLKPVGNGYGSTDGSLLGNTTIVVQSVLDGRIIGESVSTFSRNQQRILGVI